MWEMPEPIENPLELFYCYASEDEELRRELDDHLSILRRLNLIRTWHFGDIDPGAEWKPEIDRHLRAADLILLLVSSAFLASDYCYGREMMQALQRHEEGTARVVPIILRPVFYEGASFSRLQVLPTRAKPVTKWGNHDEAYKDIVEGLRRAIKELQASRRTAADGWFQKGIALNEQRCYEEAILAFDKAIQLNPNNAHAHCNKGIALGNLQRYEEAILAFDRAIQLNPSDARAYSNKGFALNQLRRY
jgi:tetratricopeptide (TPR) repeat protein